MIKTYKLSIIVPVYNVAFYLEECINSLLEQQCDSYEIIIINDGSTDGSLKICQKYDKYDNIQVINQENKGLSETRNIGIQKSKGDYILFVDSDDFIAPYVLDKLLYSITSSTPDVVFLRAMKLFPDGSTVPLDEIMDRSFIFNNSKDNVLSYIATLKKYPGSACTKLVRRSLLVDHKIYFPAGRYHEDLYWTLALLLHATSFDSLDDIYYYYRQQRPYSITSSVTEEKYIDSCNLIPYSLSLITAKEDNRRYENVIFSLMGYHLGILIYQIGFLPNTIQSKYIPFIKQHKYLLKYRTDFKSKIAYLIVSFFGVRTTAKIASFYHHTKYRFTSKDRS